jgi:hypothetical protein
MIGTPDVIWIGNSDGYVAQITREDGLERSDWVDARLIAESPAMLAALRKCQISLCDAWSPRDKEALAAANAVLARIDGLTS